MCNLKKTKKQKNKKTNALNKKQNQTYKYRAQTDGCQRKGGVMSEIGEGE